MDVGIRSARAGHPGHNFKGFTADIERTKVTVVVNDKSTETGTIAVRGDKMRLEMTKPDSRTILRDGDDFYIYTPGLKRVEEYNLGGKRQMVDSFVLLGFGNSGKDLQSQYLLTFMGESPLDNRKAVKLELTPKSEDVRQQIAKIDLWLDESNWLPIQQQFFEAGTDDYFIDPLHQHRRQRAHRRKHLQTEMAQRHPAP
jgi:outer membrane lipoprotein-sorting protein